MSALTVVALVLAGSAGALGFADRGRHAAPAAALALTGRVVDAAKMLSPVEEHKLTALSARLEQDTKVQFVIVTTPSLVGQSVAAYSLTLANAWGIGDRVRNDGLVLLVAPNERKLRIEVGRGLEKSLPNARCQEILDHIVPRFRVGDPSGGIALGARELDIAVRHPVASTR